MAGPEGPRDTRGRRGSRDHDGGPAAADRRQFEAWMSQVHADAPPTTMDKLLRYGDLVLQESATTNLVARADLPRLFMRHVRECVAPVVVNRPAAGSRVLDVGSGGGLPGIPIAIMRPDLSVDLVEARQKKAAFLERAVLLLGLRNARVHPMPLEGLPRQAEGRWDLVVARAIRWTPAMLQVLRVILAEGAPILRYGAAGEAVAGVEVQGLDPDLDRTVQIWPPQTWAHLPGE